MNNNPIYNKTHIPWLIVFAVLLACLTPRFISFMKINVGLQISFYAIMIVVAWIIYMRKFKIVLSFHYFEQTFLYILFIATIISGVQCININGWFQYIYYILITIMAMNLFLKYNSEILYNKLIIAIIVALAIHLLIGFYEVLNNRYLFAVGGFSQRIYGLVPVGIFYNPNDYSMFIATMLPFPLYYFFVKKGFLKKFVNGIIVIASVILLITTMSRSVMIGFSITIMLLLLLFFKNKRYKLTTILFTTISLSICYIVPVIRNWITNFWITNSVDVQSTSDFYRINLIKNGFYFLKETYGFGVGAGNLRKWFDLYSIYPIGEIRYIHNWYAEILVTFGIIVFILYIIFHFKLLLGLYRSVKVTEKIVSLNTAFLISFILFSITSISSSCNVYSEWIWMYFALVISYNTYCSKNIE